MFKGMTTQFGNLNIFHCIAGEDGGRGGKGAYYPGKIIVPLTFLSLFHHYLLLLQDQPKARVLMTFTIFEVVQS
jgi:hypothetical protein